MADIKQAAKWLQEGEFVRRAAARRYEEAIALNTTLGFLPPVRLLTATGQPRSFSIHDVLADDWEVVE